MFGLDRESNIWLSIYFPASWTTQFGHGLVTTVVGPTQPYLAEQTGVSIATVNFVWTFGFIGYLVGSLITGFIFKQYIKTARKKLWFLFINIFLAGIFVIILPLTSSFPLLVAARLLQHFTLGSFMTADASMVPYVIGPERCPPFTMFQHATIAAGFAVSSVLVQPFLPDNDDVSKDKLCDLKSEGNNTTNGTRNFPAPWFKLENEIFQHPQITFLNKSFPILTSKNEISEPFNFDDKVIRNSENKNSGLQSVPKIAWPFIITGTWCIVFSFGFLVLSFLPFKMPRYYNEEEMEEQLVQGPQIKNVFLFFTLVMVFCGISCGIERIFQPMATTFGLCGPLDLTPSEAVVSDSCFNGGFTAGRIASALVAGFLMPRTMILSSLVMCTLASILLLIVGGTSKWGFYIGLALLGCFVSWQFGACYSFVASKVNVTGQQTSLFFIGCGLFSLATPPLAGYLFTSSLGAMSIIYLTLLYLVLQAAAFLGIFLITRSSEKQKT